MARFRLKDGKIYDGNLILSQNDIVDLLNKQHEMLSLNSEYFELLTRVGEFE